MIKPIKRTRRVLELPVADIRPNPMQPRRAFRQPELQELADSIRRHGGPAAPDGAAHSGRLGAGGGRAAAAGRPDGRSGDGALPGNSGG